MNILGQAIRDRREHLRASDPSFSLRQVAERVGVGPAYLSQVENGQTVPTEDRIIQIADELAMDRDVALALAGKVAPDLIEAIAARPELFASLIRQLRELPDHAIARVVREASDGDW